MGATGQSLIERQRYKEEICRSPSTSIGGKDGTARLLRE
jgi:hypothetical protein